MSNKLEKYFFDPPNAYRGKPFWSWNGKLEAGELVRQVHIMKEMGMELNTVRAGHANMFLSPLFREAFANITYATVELYNTDGSQGAARGAGVGAGIYKNYEEAFSGLKSIETIEPSPNLFGAYEDAYENWLKNLNN